MYQTKDLKVKMFSLWRAGTLIWFSKLPSAVVLIKFCLSSVYLSYPDPPGFPVFAWPPSTSSPSQSVTPVRPTTPPTSPESRTPRTHCTHIHTPREMLRIVAKDTHLCLRVRQPNICCYLWAAGSKWGIQWLFKALVSSGHLGQHCYCFN